jgi:peptide/nickel transport system permease protein
MLAYIIRRLGVALLVTAGVAAISYALLHAIAPDPGYVALGTRSSPLAVAAWDKTHGYDRPELVQILDYIWGIARLHFGYSYKLNQSVSALLKENVGRSVYLSLASLILALIIAVPLGIAQAVKRNSPGDYAATTLNFILYSMPSFFLGIILIQFFALDWHLVPPLVNDQITTTWAAIIHPTQLVLPIVTLALIQVASFSRYMRSSALDTLAEDYIRLARAKGLSERVVLTRHLLRNACLPMITLIGLSIPTLLAGNLLIEYLFNYPGLGLMFYTALGNLDYNVMLGYVVLGGMLTVLGNLIADIALTVADPRVRLD